MGIIFSLFLFIVDGASVCVFEIYGNNIQSAFVHCRQSLCVYLKYMGIIFGLFLFIIDMHS